MAQRISRAKRTVSGVRFDQPGDVATVLRVLYLVFNEGYSGDVDLAAEAIRLTRQLARDRLDDPRGVRPARAHAAPPRPPGRPDRARRQPGAARRAGPQPVGHRARSPRASRSSRPRWPATGSASSRPRPPSRRCTPTPARAEETDWVQIVEWYDELLAPHRQPGRPAQPRRGGGRGRRAARRARRARRAGRRRCPGTPRSRRTSTSATATSRPRPGCTPRRRAAAPNIAERDHLTRQAARLRALIHPA